MQYLPEFLTIAGIHLLAVMSPGPDFAMIVRNSLVYSKKTAIYSSLGLAAGILVHVTYSLVGIGLIISQSILLFSVIKFFGAGYLIFIGYKSIMASHGTETRDPEQISSDITRFQGVKMGFFTNVLNPKVTLFFLSLFTQIINSDTPLPIRVLYGVENSLMTFVWFGFVATILSHSIIRKKFTSIQGRLEKIFGFILIALGIKVALSSSK